MSEAPNVASDTLAPLPPQTNKEEDTAIYTVCHLKTIAYNLHDRIQRTRVRGVDGFDKYKRSVKRELEKLQAMPDETATYSSTNIFYLLSIWNFCLEHGLNNINAVCKRVKYDDPQQDKQCRVNIDVVADNQLKWIKIKSKNPFSIQLNLLKSETRSNIAIVAEHYILAAKCNKVKFRAPTIEFVFAKGITSDVAHILRGKGIVVIGRVIEDNILFADEPAAADDTDNQHTSSSSSEHDVNVDDTAVNLGPKTMMSLISALANNELHDEFWQTVENYVLERQEHPDTYKASIWQQALNFTYNSRVMSKLFSGKSTDMLTNLVGAYYEEVQYPVMPVIMQYLGTRKLYCCQSAWDSVARLVTMGAGHNERNRFEQLRQQITVVADQISERTAKLAGKGFSDINKAVFGTGDTLRMLTVTGAPNFARKAKQQKGVDFYCKIHDVRPFVEQYQVGFEIFKINKGFDYDKLKYALQQEDINLELSEDNESDEDGDHDEEQKENQADDVIELEEEFDSFNLTTLAACAVYQ